MQVRLADSSLLLNLVQTPSIVSQVESTCEMMLGVKVVVGISVLHSTTASE